MFRTIALALVASSVLVAPVAAKGKTKKADQDGFTYSEWAEVCEMDQGKPVFTKGTAACDYPGDNDIVCDAGGGTVGECTQGTVIGRIIRPEIIAPNNGPVGQVATSSTSTSKPSKSRFNDKRTDRHIGGIINMNGKMAPITR